MARGKRRPKPMSPKAGIKRTRSHKKPTIKDSR